MYCLRDWDKVNNLPFLTRTQNQGFPEAALKVFITFELLEIRKLKVVESEHLFESYMVPRESNSSHSVVSRQSRKSLNFFVWILLWIFYDLHVWPSGTIFLTQLKARRIFVRFFMLPNFFEEF